MTPRQLEIKARSEWGGLREVRARYPTFSHYWRERYLRVYGLDTPAPALQRLIARARV